MVKPDSFNHNDINGAMDRMEGNAHYLYYGNTGIKRYWFDTTPNVNILINQAKGNISTPDITAEILRRVIEKSRGIQLFNILVNPSEDIPEQMKLTLVILSPQYLANPREVNGLSRPIIEKLATKKGNSERIYRNTMLFLLCSEIGIGKLQDDVKNYLACQKISSEYSSQLNNEQKNDIKRRIEEAGRQSEISLVSAYSILARHSVKNGIETLIIKQFKDSLDSQINHNAITALKEEEWLLESVGLSTLRNNNLLPTPEHAIRAKDIYEAFFRFDDKPMVTGPEAVSKSIQKYCTNGEYCIATGDGINYTRYFYQEYVPFFDVNDATYWLVDKHLKPQPQVPAAPVVSDKGGVIPTLTQVNEDPVPPDGNGTVEVSTSKKFKSITVSGNVPLERYTELFNYFIIPFAMNGNKIEIEVTFKIKSNTGSPIDESKPQYKSAKEAAKQLGLKFDEEI